LEKEKYVLVVLRLDIHLPILRWVDGFIYPHLQNQQILTEKTEACLANYGVYHMSMRLFHQTNTGNLKKPIRVFSGMVIMAKGNVTWFKWKYIFKEIICVALLDSLKTKNQCLRYFSEYMMTVELTEL
jgi:hypothetical protein